METKGLCPNENGLSLGHIQPFSVVPCFRRTGGVPSGLLSSVFRLFRLSGKVHIGLSGFQRLHHQSGRLACGHQIEHGIFQQIPETCSGTPVHIQLSGVDGRVVGG